MYIRSELVPEYEGSTFEMKDYTKTKDACDYVFSNPLFSNGLTWKLKVYPNGNGIAKGCYLSIFLHMESVNIDLIIK